MCQVHCKKKTSDEKRRKFFYSLGYRTKGVDIEFQSTTYWKDIRESPLLLPFLRP